MVWVDFSFHRLREKEAKKTRKRKKVESSSSSEDDRYNVDYVVIKGKYYFYNWIFMILI